MPGQEIDVPTRTAWREAASAPILQLWCQNRPTLRRL